MNVLKLCILACIALACILLTAARMSPTSVDWVSGLLLGLTAALPTALLIVSSALNEKHRHTIQPQPQQRERRVVPAPSTIELLEENRQLLLAAADKRQQNQLIRENAQLRRAIRAEPFPAIQITEQ